MMQTKKNQDEEDVLICVLMARLNLAAAELPQDGCELTINS